MAKGNKPILKTNRIVVEDAETKEKLIEIAATKEQSIKEIVIDLVEQEFKKIGGGENSPNRRL